MSQLEPDVEIDEEVFEPGESNGTVIRLSLTAAPPWCPCCSSCGSSARPRAWS